jgi:hypothetical protein
LIELRTIAVFMLNLLFEFTRPDGRFESSPLVPSPPPAGTLNLNQSRHWLKLTTTPEPADVRPETDAQWDDLGPRGTLYIPKITGAGADPANIAIRIAPFRGPVPQGMKLQLVMSFGRPDVAARTQYASPFTDTGNAPPAGSVLTTFVNPPNYQPGLIDPTEGRASWFFPLKRAVVLRPDKPNVTDRYEFSLGVIVMNQASVTRHFGEDPEMDVGQ